MVLPARCIHTSNREHTVADASNKIRIALAPGDGIGTEIMQACLDIFEAAGVMNHVEFVPVEMGKQVFTAGDSRVTDDSVGTDDDSDADTTV